MFEKYQDCREEYAQVKYPGCDGKVYVSKNGQVLDVRRGAVLKRQRLDGRSVVVTDLWDGEREYLVDVLVLLAYGKLKLPTYALDYVDPFHIDENEDNFHPKNIGYRFSEPIECRDHKGFFFIPFFSNYAISREGVVKNVKNGSVVLVYIKKPSEASKRKNIKDGYAVYCLPSEMGRTSIGRHRALMLAFTWYPHNVDKLDVNHKNGVPGDDRLDNLEWATRSENNIHAVRAGLRTQNIHCYAYNVYTKEELAFASFTDCGRYFGVGAHAIIGRCDSKQIVYDGGWLFKVDKDTPWREVDTEGVARELQAQSTPTEIRSFNIYTREERIHKSIAQMAKDLGMACGQGPRHQLATGRGRPYYGYLFKHMNDDIPWPEYTEDQLDFYRENPSGRARAVLARHKDGEERLFANLQRVVEFFPDILRTPKHVCKAVDRGYNVNGWTLTYKAMP